MNYCTNCGSKLEGNTAFCPNCGQRLQGLPAEVEESRAARREQREITRIQEEMKDAKENYYGWSVTSGIVGGLGIAVIVAWFMADNRVDWYIPAGIGGIAISIIFVGISIYYWQKYKDYKNQL